jgi:hypothetical protein
MFGHRFIRPLCGRKAPETAATVGTDSSCGLRNYPPEHRATVWSQLVLHLETWLVHHWGSTATATTSSGSLLLLLLRLVMRPVTLAPAPWYRTAQPERINATTATRHMPPTKTS